MRTDVFMRLLALDLDDLRRDLMEMTLGMVHVGELGYGYKPGVSELAEVMLWQRAYQEGSADYEHGCALLRDGNALVWSFVNARYVAQSGQMPPAAARTPRASAATRARVTGPEGRP